MVQPLRLAMRRFGATILCLGFAASAAMAQETPEPSPATAAREAAAATPAIPENGPEENVMSAQKRTFGADTKRLNFKVLWLRPVGDDGMRPTQAAIHWIAEGDSSHAADGIDEGFTTIFDQDVGNRRTQRDVLGVARSEQTLANYQEIRIRHLHRTLDRFLEAKTAPRNRLL